VTDRFEPGSVMKVFTLAAGLTTGTLRPTDTVYCEHGTYQLGSVTIHDTHLNDWLTPTQILARSSNVGALKIGLAAGEPALYATLRRFGFGEPTGLPLPGEAAGVLRPKGRAWYDVETANASFGQGISVTTVQLAVAVGAIANGGRLLEPLLVRKATDGRGNVVREVAPHVRRQVLEPGTARMLTDMLTAVTEDGGTGVEAAVPGFHVAGKTATAQKIDPATGKYSTDKYTASFVGMVPAERPRLVIAVVLDEPMIGRYGGDLAGPVFRRVAEASLRYLGVTPPGGVGKVERAVKSVDTQPVLATRSVGPDGVSDAVTPAALAQGDIRVPDATGLPAHEAVRAITRAGLLPQLEGSGRVVRQQPPAGSAARKGSSVRLVFESPS
jgi:cell division protein FtsI (penicillin-binding protein 3)